MKLHLGCGPRYINGWTNVDWSSKYKVDISLNLEKDRLPFEKDTVDEVISSHLIEHLDRWGGEHHLSEIHRVLKKGGKFTLAFPDLAKIVDCYEGRDKSVLKFKGKDTWLVEAIFETHRNETVVHKYGYTESTMKTLLLNKGFGAVKVITQPLVINGDRICDYRYAITILEITK